jgi:hypothetical protein
VPDASGKLQLQDYDNALVARGFDGFQPIERTQLINFGYRYIARKFPWSWEQTSQQYTVNPGSATIPVGAGAPLSIGSVRYIEHAEDPYRTHMRPMREEYFTEHWLMQDLTSQAVRGTPFRYIVFQGQIYVLPPPQVVSVFTVYFYQYLPDMILTTDVSVLPMQMDEMVLQAALVRCHRRAHELQLAEEQQMQVNEAVDDLLQNDAWMMEELQERVSPDDQWL